METAKQVLDSARVYKDCLLERYANEVLIMAHFGARDFEATLSALDKASETAKLSVNQQCVRGLSLMELGRYAEADNIYNCIKNDSASQNLPLIYEMALKRGDTSKALSALNSLYDNLDSVFVVSLNQNYSLHLSDLYRYENIIKTNELKEMKLWNMIRTIAGCALILAVVFISIYLYKKQKNKIERNVLIAQNLQELLRVKESEHTNLQNTVKNLLASQFEVIDSLCKTFYEGQATDVQKKISNEVEKLIELLSSDKGKIAELEDFVDEHQNNLISSFKSDMPNLKDADYRLFLYLSLGFSTSAITLFLKEDKLEAVYNRKARLKTKIRKLEASRSDWYMSFVR